MKSFIFRRNVLLNSFYKYSLFFVIVLSFILPYMVFGGGSLFTSVDSIFITNNNYGGLANGVSGCTPGSLTVSIAAAPFGGINAQASAVINNGVVTGYIINNPGQGYLNPPNVTVSNTFSLGGCSQVPKAVALVSGGVVSSINMIGSCTSVDVVIDNSPTSDRATATATIQNGLISGFTITHAGLGYTTAPNVSLTGHNCAGTPTAATTIVTGGSTAPVLTEVTPVHTPGLSTSPYFTIKSNEAGALTFTGSCDSYKDRINYANTPESITLISDTMSPFYPGAHSDCYVKLLGDNSNIDSFPLHISNFEIATLVEKSAPSTSDPANSTTPSYTFTSTKSAWPIIISSPCKSATTTSATIPQGSTSVDTTILLQYSGSGNSNSFPIGTYSTCTIQLQNGTATSNMITISPFSIATAGSSSSSSTSSSSSSSTSSTGGSSSSSSSNSSSAGFNPSTSTPVGGISAGIKNPLGDSYPDIPSFIKQLLKVVLIIGVPLVVLAIIYSGFLFVTAQGNPEEIGKAKKALLYTVIGAFLLLGCFVLADAISATVNDIKNNS